MARVAIVEDMGSVGDVTEKMMLSQGHTVKRYGLPSEFEEARGWEDTDIIIMDNKFGPWGNPKELGSEYLKEMFLDNERRERCVNPPKYCLFSAAFHHYEERVWDMNKLGVYYLEKPFTVAELEKTIGYMMIGKPPFWVPRKPTDSESLPSPSDTTD
ncbi:MAG: hypothetical protein V3V26_02390 [Candidatus Aenigmarchaeota archaeon]